MEFISREIEEKFWTLVEELKPLLDDYVTKEITQKDRKVVEHITEATCASYKDKLYTYIYDLYFIVRDYKFNSWKSPMESSIIYYLDKIEMLKLNINFETPYMKCEAGTFYIKEGKQIIDNRYAYLEHKTNINLGYYILSRGNYGLIPLDGDIIKVDLKKDLPYMRICSDCILVDTQESIEIIEHSKFNILKGFTAMNLVMFADASNINTIYHGIIGKTREHCVMFGKTLSTAKMICKGTTAIYVKRNGNLLFFIGCNGRQGQMVARVDLSNNSSKSGAYKGTHNYGIFIINGVSTKFTQLKYSDVVPSR